MSTMTPGAPAPPWYVEAIFYELHVRSFFDSSGDGIGDFGGLIRKLDYLQELGVTALWLMPFYPSPLRDDGYDVADHRGVHPSYGTLRDLRRFLKEAHRRGLRVVTELVCNHTSDRHPWFQRARRAPPGSSARRYYVWSDTPDRYPEVRVIFKDFERSNWTWDPVARAYYWHRFYSHQPDLNFDHPPVRREMLRLADFWFSLGVDGLRLDAVPYLFEREGTNGESLPETHAYLRELRRSVDQRHPDRLLIAEANQWPEEAAAYFGNGDECHMCFHFPLMPRLFLGVRMEDRFPIVDILAQTPETPPRACWGLFLRNHDELTLEMVTDEERDLMHRAYTKGPEALLNLGIRRRLAPLLGNNRRRIELMNALLLSLPGVPFLYYGDEIGMGDNVRLGDRNAVRTPMQWSPERNGGFSTAPAHRLFLPPVRDPAYHYRSVNVRDQLADPQSLLHWMRRVIGIRRQHPALATGDFQLVRAKNRKILAYIRATEAERILVVANLSRFVQSVSLDLRAHRGSVPVELFGGSSFRAVGAEPYHLTLGPHSFYWLTLPPPPTAAVTPAAQPAPRRLALDRPRRGLADATLRLAIQRALPGFLARQPWFVGHDRDLRRAEVRDAAALPRDIAGRSLVIVDVTYRDGEAEPWLLVIGIAAGERARSVLESAPSSVIVESDGPFDPWVAYEASADGDLARAIATAIGSRVRRRGGAGAFAARRTSAFSLITGGTRASEGEELARIEQRINTVALGERTVMKIFRRLGTGPNPELELAASLTEDRAFIGSPRLAGSLEYVPARGDPLTLALLRAYTPAESDLATVTEASLKALLAGEDRSERRARLSREALEPDLARCRLLASRMVELHVALAAIDAPSFHPEPYGKGAQRALYQSLRSLAATTLEALRAREGSLPRSVRSDARAVLAREQSLDQRLRWLVTATIDCLRIRVHGDLHLGQVLVSAGNLVLIDFEGEPWRPIADRRLKRSVLRDLAAVLSSYDDIADRATAEAVAGGAAERTVRTAAGTWLAAMQERLVTDHVRGLTGIGLVPSDPATIDGLLDVLLLERALSEIWGGLSLGSRDVGPPLRRLAALLRGRPARTSVRSRRE